MKFTIVIVRPSGYRYSDCFKELAETVMYGLRALGHDAEMAENGFRRDTKHIIFGGHLLSADSLLPPGSVLYNWEQVERGGGIGNLATLGGKYTIWDYAKPNCDEWAKKRIQAVHVPLGYVSEMTRITKIAEDIDVLFYGSMSKRRGAILEQLDKLGLKVVVAINNAYGVELNALIARAKVILNVHVAEESRVFEISRVGYLLANKKAVVSEQSIDDYTSLKDGIKVVPYLALVDACRDLVMNDAARRTLAQKGFEKFSSTLEAAFLEEVLEPIPA